MLVDERHLHVLAGRGHQLPALRSGGRSLLFVAAHAHEEEEASNDQGDGNAGHQDVQDPHLAAVSGTWGPQWGGHQFSKDTTFSAISSPTPSLPPLSKVFKYDWLFQYSAFFLLFFFFCLFFRDMISLYLWSLS